MTDQPGLTFASLNPLARPALEALARRERTRAYPYVYVDLDRFDRRNPTRIELVETGEAIGYAVLANADDHTNPVCVWTLTTANGRTLMVTAVGALHTAALLLHAEYLRAHG